MQQGMLEADSGSGEGGVVSLVGRQWWVNGEVGGGFRVGEVWGQQLRL